MPRDTERIERIQHALQEGQLHAVVCAFPSNVLMLSGYWPFIGTAIAVAVQDGTTGLLVPEDSKQPAAQGWPDELRAFPLGSLNDLRSLEENVRDALPALLRALGLNPRSRIAYEDSAHFEPTTYAAMNVYGCSMPALISEVLPDAQLASGSEMLARLRAVLTQDELHKLRLACDVVRDSFAAGRAALCSGLTEVQIADLFRMGLSAPDMNGDAPAETTLRADGFVYCMSGPNSAKAYAAYQRSTDRTVHNGDFVLVHCNSYVDGFWTDVTRTFCLKQGDDQKHKIQCAIREARDAALSAARPGVPACSVDAAARNVLAGYGYGENFKHATGHGVGFSAISHLARPRIHPASDEILKTGMTFNIEPAVYIDGCCGCRHCDVLTVTRTGAEVLTPF